ncbi:hypothetical protein [Lysinibacter cavernae]|uniref:Uncharacterized protein n=1 Tax=Lysinibacter cavernae TaxID=1640652 RepID=A0A7X5QYZ3_9MICO|nr:hypothetical protein [Lysinibacter cavernae]NIH52558.1 hypothetical protein [Lysinibacter cavernae]
MSVRDIWESITEPRHLKTAYAAIYLIVLGIGAGSLVTPPAVMTGEIGELTSIAWSLLFIVGAIGGIVAVFPGWWWVERLAIGMILVGIGIYFAVVIWADMHDGGVTRYTQAGLSFLSGSVFYIRWLLIKKYSFEPRGGTPEWQQIPK